MFAKCVASKHLWRSKAAKHGTRRRYNEGCRCEDCTADNTACHQEYRQRLIGAEPANPSSVVTVSSPVTPGPVEAGVEAEIAELADARPGLAAAALALARILDNPRAVSSQPAAPRCWRWRANQFIQQRIRHTNRRQRPSPLPSRTVKSRRPIAARNRSPRCRAWVGSLCPRVTDRHFTSRPSTCYSGARTPDRHILASSARGKAAKA